MKIVSLFEKDIHRPIKGVVIADDRAKGTVWQELDEYVVTKELDRHFRSFFRVYADSLRNNIHDESLSGRMGVWISGFFGSGKSHFLKILSYLLSNHKATNPQDNSTCSATEFFHDKINDPTLLANIQKAAASPTDVILFNIDSHADAQDGSNAILTVFWRVFNEMQGFYSGDLHLAQVERHLTEKGRYEAFKTRYQEELGESWEESRDAWQFNRDQVVSALAHALEQSEESMEKWFDNEGKSLAVTIENFAKTVRRYLDSKGDNHRILFLVDEIGQFIGSDSARMLQLQTITENLGTACGGRAWVIVTSQEDIEGVVGEFQGSKSNDFSKIQGRFKTKLSLSSSNTDEVIQYRLLRKKTEAKAELATLYKDKGDILRSQLSFTQDCATLKSFSHEKDFIDNYPVAPYHFQLLQKVFESIRKAGVAGTHLSRGERSMLDAFQSSVRSISEESVGALVPLHAFYPAIEAFLDTTIKATIDRAVDNEGLQHPIDTQLLKTLFLIRYVDIVKPNIDNIVTLFISEVDTDKIMLKRNLEAALQRLERETLINRNGDLYYFLTNEERDISREIKRVSIDQQKQNNFLAEILFEEILKGHTKYRVKEYKRDYEFQRVVDEYAYKAHGEAELTLKCITQFHDSYTQMDEARCAWLSSSAEGHVFFTLPADNALNKEVLTYLQTDVFIRDASTRQDTATIKAILRTRQEENRQRRATLVRTLEKLLLSAKVYTAGQETKLTPNSRNSAKTMVDAALDYVIRNTYSCFSYISTLQNDPIAEAKAVLTTNTVGQYELVQGLATVNGQAIKGVEGFLRLRASTHTTVMLDEIKNRFTAKPYGWPEGELVLLMARLYMAKSISLTVDGTVDADTKAVTQALLSSRAWKNTIIQLRNKPAEEDINKAFSLYKYISGKIIEKNADSVILGFRTLLQEWKQEFDQWRRQNVDGRYPITSTVDECLAVLRPLLAIKDDAAFIRKIRHSEPDLTDVSEAKHTLQGFFTNQIGAWTRLLEALDNVKASESILMRNAAASQSLEQLHTIRNAESPFEMLHSVDEHIHVIQSIHDSELAAYRDKALAKIDASIAEIHDMLTSFHAKDDERNSILYPLQCLRKQIMDAKSIPNIAYIELNDVEDTVSYAKDKTFDLMMPSPPAITPNPEPPVSPDGTKPVGKSDPKPLPAPKPKKTVSVKLNSLMRLHVLETEADIESYTNRLKAELMARLEEGIRLRVE